MQFNLKKVFKIFFVMISLVSSLVSWYFYFNLFWLYRNELYGNESFFDQDTYFVYHAQSEILIFPSLGFSFLSIFLVILWILPNRKAKPNLI